MVKERRIRDAVSLTKLNDSLVTIGEFKRIRSSKMTTSSGLERASAANQGLQEGGGGGSKEEGGREGREEQVELEGGWVEERWKGRLNWRGEEAHCNLASLMVQFSGGGADGLWMIVPPTVPTVTSSPSSKVAAARVSSTAALGSVSD